MSARMDLSRKMKIAAEYTTLHRVLELQLDVFTRLALLSWPIDPSLSKSYTDNVRSTETQLEHVQTLLNFYNSHFEKEPYHGA